jgi:hypothetical protein
MRGPATPARSVKKREEEDTKREMEDAMRNLEYALLKLITGLALRAVILRTLTPHRAARWVSAAANIIFFSAIQVYL